SLSGSIRDHVQMKEALRFVLVVFSDLWAAVEKGERFSAPLERDCIRCRLVHDRRAQGQSRAAGDKSGNNIYRACIIHRHGALAVTATVCLPCENRDTP